MATRYRETNIDYLRILACILVVVIHISGPLFLKSPLDSYGFKANLALDSFSRVAVPIFVMISGRYLLNYDYIFDRDRYVRSILRIIRPLLFWTAVYVGLYLLFKLYKREVVDFQMILEKIVKGKPSYHLWYLFMIVGLYVLGPFLNQSIKVLNSQQLKKLSWGLIGFSLIHQSFNLVFEVSVFWGLWFVDYLGYFFLGFVYKNTISENKYFYLVGYFGASLITMIASYFTFKFYQQIPFFNYNSIFVVISSYCLYRFFDNVNIPESKILDISKYTFGIYLIHPLFILIFLTQLQKSLLFELVLGASIFILSYLAIKIAAKVGWLNKYLM